MSFSVGCPQKPYESVSDAVILGLSVLTQTVKCVQIRSLKKPALCSILIYYHSCISWMFVIFQSWCHFPKMSFS